MSIATIGGATRRLGAWVPARRKVAAVKPTIDLAALRTKHTIAGFPTDYDQGQLGSCGPNSVAEVFEFFRGSKFSRLFLYYWTRATESDVDGDDGVTIADLLDVAHAIGMPPESVWPYDISKFREMPPMPALVAAIQHRVEQQDAIADLDHLLFELDRDQPVTFGFQVPSSMEDGSGVMAATGGVVNVPSSTDPSLGGHCVNAIGFDRDRGLVQCTCHYGAGFADHGTIWLPFAHFTSGNATDLRAIRGVT